MDTIARVRRRQAIMGDPSLSPDFPLSVLLARGKIDREMHDAGMTFGALYVRVFGAPHASGAGWAKMLGEDSRSMPSDARDFRAEAEYAHSLRQLDQLPEPHLSRQLVHQLAAYLQHDWYVQDVYTRRDVAERHRKRTKTVRAALLALVNMEPVRVGEIGANPLGIAGKGEPIAAQRVA